MIAHKIKCTIIGSGIAYNKKVVDIPERTRILMKKLHGSSEVFFFTCTEGRHYTQSGFKVVTYRPDRYEFYHREPTPKQLKAIQRKEKRKE